MNVYIITCSNDSANKLQPYLTFASFTGDKDYVSNKAMLSETLPSDSKYSNREIIYYYEYPLNYTSDFFFIYPCIEYPGLDSTNLPPVEKYKDFLGLLTNEILAEIRRMVEFPGDITLRYFIHEKDIGLQSEKGVFPVEKFIDINPSLKSVSSSIKTIIYFLHANDEVYGHLIKPKPLSASTFCKRVIEIFSYTEDWVNNENHNSNA